LGGANRIGHGTQLIEYPKLVDAVCQAGIPLEVCLTSNVQTGIASFYETHPMRHYFDQGIPVCLCTDNRLMSGVTLTREYEHARDELRFSWTELARVARMGFESAFASDDAKAAMLELFDSEMARQA
jgi:adenosine deaminase